ncbi:glycosyltransferase family 9 protein [Pectobacterium aroidearum]|uniref:glycosyltransferase family 9 protein n=1 Tax=Pectobacterium aroidearum TaxID=1201031 RepID=UPI0015F482F5|nr:glycosyltransferase family 9 protein [Pectobacterium aroidearum]MBA5603005.1 glycosyltransferase family 9 protein [Pectobacterium aroidearum]
MKISTYLSQLNRKRKHNTKKIKNKIKILISTLLMDSKKGKPIKIEDVNSIGILIFNVGIGDVIIASGLFKELLKNGYSLTLFISKNSEFLFRERTDMNIILVDNEKPSIPTSLHIDLLIDLYGRVDDYFHLKYVSVIKKIKHSFCIGFNAKYEKIYNKNVIISGKVHITDAYKKILLQLNINVQEIPYDIKVPNKNLEKIENFLYTAAGRKIIAFNPFSASQVRDLTPEQIIKLVFLLKERNDILVIIIGEKRKIENIIIQDNVITSPFTEYWDAAAIIKKSDLVISVDTSVVHLCNALDKELICIYSSEVIDNYECDYFFSPNYKKSIQLISPQKSARHMDVMKIFSLINTHLPPK